MSPLRRSCSHVALSCDLWLLAYVCLVGLVEGLVWSLRLLRGLNISRSLFLEQVHATSFWFLGFLFSGEKEGVCLVAFLWAFFSFQLAVPFFVGSFV